MVYFFNSGVKDNFNVKLNEGNKCTKGQIMLIGSRRKCLRKGSACDRR